MRRHLSIFLFGLALQGPRAGFAAEEGPRRAKSALPLVEVGKYKFPPANRWALSQDEKVLFYTIDGEVRCFDRETQTDAVVAPIPGSIDSICLSRSSRYLAVCSDSSAYLITSPGANAAGRRQNLKTVWTAAAFSANEDCLLGCAKEGQVFDAVDLKATALAGSPQIRRVANVAPDLVNRETPLVTLPDNRFVVVAEGAIMDTDGVAGVRDRAPIGSWGMYDLSFGPLHGNWVLSFDQPITAKGKYMIMVVKQTKFLARTPDGQSAWVKWDSSIRVNWAQAVGDSSFWAQLYRDSTGLPLILRKYTIQFEKEAGGKADPKKK